MIFQVPHSRFRLGAPVRFDEADDDVDALAAKAWASSIIE